MHVRQWRQGDVEFDVSNWGKSFDKRERKGQPTRGVEIEVHMDTPTSSRHKFAKEQSRLKLGSCPASVDIRYDVKEGTPSPRGLVGVADTPPS